jgi:hypothetical protein
MKPVRPFFSLLLIGSLGLCGLVWLLLWRSANFTNPVSGGGGVAPTVKVVALANIACKSGSNSGANACQQKEVVKMLVSEQAAAVLIAGGLQYEDGSELSYQGNFTSLWSELKQKSYSVPGAVEYRTPAAEGYFNYWNGTERSSKHAGDRTKGYYSFDITGWHIVALNSNCQQVNGCNMGSAQAEWLRQDLQSSKTRCTLAFWSEPRYASAAQIERTKTQDFWQLLEQKNAELVVSGQDYLYERLLPARTDGTTTNDNGLRQFIAGAGGVSVQQVSGTVDGSEHVEDKEIGYLVLTLRPTSYSWAYKTLNGQVVDQGTSQCR